MLVCGGEDKENSLENSVPGVVVDKIKYCVRYRNC